MSDKDTIRQVINGQIRQEDVDSQLQDILNSKMRSRMNAAQGISDDEPRHRGHRQHEEYDEDQE